MNPLSDSYQIERRLVVTRRQRFVGETLQQGFLACVLGRNLADIRLVLEMTPIGKLHEFVLSLGGQLIEIEGGKSAFPQVRVDHERSFSLARPPLRSLIRA